MTSVDVTVTNASNVEAHDFTIGLTAAGATIVGYDELDPLGVRTVSGPAGSSVTFGDDSEIYLAPGASYAFRVDLAALDDTGATTRAVSFEASILTADPGNQDGLVNKDPDISTSDVTESFLTSAAPNPALQTALVGVSLSGTDIFVQGTQEFLRSFASVHNDGPDPASDVTVMIDADGPIAPIDPFAQVIGATNEADWFTVTQGTGTSWTIHFRQAIAGGDTVVLPLLFSPTDSGVATVTATVSQPGVDTDAAGQIASVTQDIGADNAGVVPPDPDVKGTITAGPQQVDGQTQTVAVVDLTVTMNAAAAPDTVVDIAVPAGAVLLGQGQIDHGGSAVDLAGSVQSGSTADMLTWDAGALLAGQTVGIEFRLELPDGTAPVVSATAEDASSPAGTLTLDTAHPQPVLGTPDSGGEFSLVVSETGSPGHTYRATVPAGIATDPDGGALQFAADGAWPSTLAISADGVITGTVPGNDQPAGAQSLYDGLRVVITNPDGGHVVATVADTFGEPATVDPPIVEKAIPSNSFVAGTNATWHVVQDVPWEAFGPNNPAYFDDPDRGLEDGVDLTYTVAGLPTSLHFDPLDDTIDGTPTLNDVGSYTLTVTATKAGGLSASQTTTLAIVPPTVDATPPAAGPAPTLEADAGSAVGYTLPADTFTNSGGGALTVVASSLPYWLAYDPVTEQFTGTAPLAGDATTVVTLLASDGMSGTANSTLTITLDGLDPPPTASPFTVGPPAGTYVAAVEPIVIPAATLLAAATPGEPGQSLTLGYGEQPQHGTLVIDDDGGVTYTPDQGYEGTDTFDDRVTDGTVASAFATVTINVPHVDIQPSGYEGGIGVTADPVATPSLTVIGSIANAGYDPDNGPDLLTLHQIDEPSQGTFSVADDGAVTWVAPMPGFVGTDTFVFTLFDGLLSSIPAFRTVASSLADGTAPPQGNSTCLLDDFDTPLTASLPSANDPEGGSLIYSLSRPATDGRATITPDGMLDFTPDKGVSGTAIVPFAVTDAVGYVSEYDAVVIVSPACYVAGTLIATTVGEVLVGRLVVGDMVLTASGQPRPVRWIGRRSYTRRFLAANPEIQPIRFTAGSLGDGLPRRDLLVSPEHAMFLDGLLIPARCLVNGSIIKQERSLERVDYFHVELDTHDVLLAEGAPSESFLDDDSRGLFHNAAEYAALYPEAPATGRFCAPKVTDGYELEAIRQQLAVVAGEVARAA